jgi:hypothetical protein
MTHGAQRFVGLLRITERKAVKEFAIIKLLIFLASVFLQLTREQWRKCGPAIRDVTQVAIGILKISKSYAVLRQFTELK